MSLDHLIRKRFRVSGTVQGVGFRPFVFGRAVELGLAGFVTNDTSGVTVEAQGDAAGLDLLESALRNEAPPLSSITRLEIEELTPDHSTIFEIRPSETGGRVRVSIPPDVATCDLCLAEVNDQLDRRHGYPFTNCTNCGPRFSIVAASPYDRGNTTMASFEMCAACATEYADPGSRRFHAQPIACPECGPTTDLLSLGSDTDPIAAAASLLLDGKIVAVKGIGGFHLACDATSSEAVARLRSRKHREEKPFAVMVRDLQVARGLVVPSTHEEDLLASPRAPIVLIRRRPGAPIAEEVAPGSTSLGMLLPYSPLHHLLLAQVDRPLVMTSGNLVDEPVAFEDEDARERLGAVADAFLTHDRPIRIRCDDSVMRVVGSEGYPIRRSRGYVPQPVSVPLGFSQPILAAGPELKHTFCLGVEDLAVVSHHIGDLQNYQAMNAFTDGMEHFKQLLGIDEVGIIAHDLHPGYLSTKWALGVGDANRVAVQHHHAHIAACLADNHRSERVIGLALDGTGMGDDGTMWGCEVLIADLEGYERFGHLSTVPLPGGDAAVREPWRMGAVYLDAAFGDEARSLALAFVRETVGSWTPILQMTRRSLNSPEASSAGRLFDAAAAVCGLRNRVGYEGQAAAELESIADRSSDLTYPFPFADGELDGISLMRAMAEDLAAGRPNHEAAAGFHNGVAHGLIQACLSARTATGLDVVALSGGTWQNVMLLQRVRKGLESQGFEVLVHRQVPCNDGGISLGQAVVANAKLG